MKLIRAQWLTTECDNGVHVVPLDDAIVHDFDDDCICGPTPELVEGGGWLIVHHGLDGRELGE